MIESLNVTDKPIRALFLNSRNTEGRKAPTGWQVPALSFQQTIKASPWEAGPGSGARAAVWTVAVAAAFLVLLELLGLLLVLLLCLLLSRYVSLLLFQLLVLPVLLLLELLSLLVLLGAELLLLLLVLLVQLRVSRVRRRQWGGRRKLVRMNGCVGTRTIVFWTRNWSAVWLRCRTIGWRLIWPSCLCGRDYCPVLKCAGFRRRRYWRFTLVH